MPKKEPMSEYYRRVREISDFLMNRIHFKPSVGIILGTGLGGVTGSIEKHKIIPYQDIPGFPISTVEGHDGFLIIGHLGGRPVLAFQGRFHFYEGYSAEEITLPVRIMAALGVRIMISSSAAGGLNPVFRPGDLMAVYDHINLAGINPLRGMNIDEWGLRFPDMSAPYDRSLLDRAEAVALGLGIRLHKGVYVAVSGPSMETPAETAFLRTIGGDAVGMSMVPEVIVARHAGLTVFGVSVITNVNSPGFMEAIYHEKVIAVAREAETKLKLLISKLLMEMEE
ncbi:MAG: purine-nucleoside phosphorylase [Pseudomonadota bacterium]